MHEDGLDRSGDVWVYYPDNHKREWKDQDLIKLIPEEARNRIEPRLGSSSGYIFDPNEARAWGHQQASLTKGPRKTKRYPSEEKRVQAKKSLRRLPPHYKTGSYATAIRRAFIRAEAAGLELTPFSPNQIRHTVVNWVDSLDIEHDAAQKHAGHKSSETTNIYRHVDKNRLIRFAPRLNEAFKALLGEE